MTSSDNFVQPAILRFDGHYDNWSMLMENYLRSKDYWNVVESGVAEPATGATEAQKIKFEVLKLKDLKANNYLFQTIDCSILETILCKETSKKIWDSMKKKYQVNVKAKRSREAIADFFSRTMAISSNMRIHGEQMQDVTIVEKILRSMTPKFNFVVCSIEDSKAIDELSIDELQCSLLVHEQKIIQHDKEAHALKATTDNPSKTSGGQDRGRGRSRGRGSYSREFRTNLNRQSAEVSNFAEKEEEVSLLMVCYASEETRQNLWYLDTRCSNHMCGDKKAFSELDESFRNTVKFGDNSVVSVIGKCNVTLHDKTTLFM
ncbi:uncharacterized protein LOC107019897 [Solanum pennellii]|uniref:Uncharacterized protein LOC107019897 n=1 Tax=Solanum pennellii TaxID=28526 RepID=A0ABM1GTF5_SOLPN|nr:uncharacterized protein LOC107019897 [Solanum pennellii]